MEEGKKKKRSRNKKRNKKKEKNEFGPLLHCIIIHYTWPWMMEPSVPPSQQEPFWNLRVYACNLSGEINMWGICQILFSFYFNENNIFRWGDSFNYKTDSYNFTLIFFPSILQAWPSFAPHLWKKKTDLHIAMWNKCILIWNQLKNTCKRLSVWIYSSFYISTKPTSKWFSRKQRYIYVCVFSENTYVNTYFP